LGGIANGDRPIVEIGALEDAGCGLTCLADLLGVLFPDAPDRLVLHRLGPFRGQREVGRIGAGEAPRVVAVPEEELQILCRVFDVDQVVHKVTDCTGLFVCQIQLIEAGIGPRTGQVPPSMILSKLSAEGIPPELPDLSESPDDPSL
jgi:hypothetical protein